LYNYRFGGGKMGEHIQLKNCAFCVDQPDYKGGVDKRIIMETENFRAFPTLGMITEGYTLIAPKEHVITYGAIPETLFGELNELKDELDRRITKEYGKPIFLEHGAIGQTITHAHLHAIPMLGGGDEVVFTMYSRDLPYVPIQGVSDLPEIWKTKGHYLYLELKNHEAFAFYTPIVPMYGRIITADVFGLPERANWKTMDRTLDELFMAETLEKLRK
jgi:diadenosine tetraphosphate (Ap4A) HIT family hydrolase